MVKFKDLKIRNKLRILSIISIISLIVLGYVSNYLFKTSKMLGLMINSERVQNNTFQAGIDDFYKYLITGKEQLLDSALVRIEIANQMCSTYGQADKLLTLTDAQLADVLFQTYKESYNYDWSNALLMANRTKLMFKLNRNKFSDLQHVVMEGYRLGEEIKSGILRHKKDKSFDAVAFIDQDLDQMRMFYHKFALIVASLNTLVNNLLLGIILAIVISLVLLIAFISKVISDSIVIPVNEMVRRFRQIARGNLKNDLMVETSNEMGELAHSFNTIQEGLREVIEYTKNVAGGDYSTPIIPRSEEDDLSIALNKMVVKLKESYDQSEQDSWFKTGVNLISEKLRGDQQLSDISAHALSFMTEFLHAQLGSIHLYDPEYQYLKLVGSTGFDPQKLKDRINLNEGIIGQAAFEHRMITLSNLPDQSYTTYSSSGEYFPREVVVMPMLFNETLVGVLELSSVHPFSDIEIQFIAQASIIIAVNLNSAVNMLKTNELLQKTQEQASELQVQQEELRVANEELVEHTKVLTENEKRLQVQQEELRVANEELEERTRQLEIQKSDISLKNQELTEIGSKLEIKARELQQASQYKSEFLANMSHELRTPLNSLLILSNLLSANKKGNLTEDQVQSARIIHKSGSDLLYLINEVLDLSKIEAGKMSIEIGAVSPQEIKGDILMNFQGSADEKKLLFAVNIQEGFPQVLNTDRYRLMQILRNLLSNAFKFTSSGSIVVDFMPTPDRVVFSSPALSGSNTCCIRVKDTGVGIPEEKLDAIFEAFQQADGSISRKYGGTGLGLSISRELIRLLGGELKLESKVNVGSSFFVYLPLAVAEASEKTEEKPANTEIRAEIPEPVSAEKDPLELDPFISDDRGENNQERAVLIIHHSKQQAEKYLQQARAKNFRAIVAPTIPEGIALAEEYKPKAIMLAIELANQKDRNYQKLKEHKFISKLPVHLITPIDYPETGAESGLKTVESTEFDEALKKLDNHLIFNSKRILLIEDDFATRNAVQDLLADFKLEIEEVQLAEEAYQILTRKKFDCIILDLGLPDYSGKELLEKLKKNNISIPKVIVYTGKEMSKEEIKSLNTYTNTIILKGLKSDERLMDEVTLFLHQVSKTIPEPQVKAVSVDDAALFQGKKILVVDDEIRNVFALGKILEDKDIEVFEAENGQVAIDILKENKEIDLVLMDVMMPVMNGYEAMRVIRQTPEIKDIPIICLTAKAMKEDHENALKNGANDYLSKPLNEDKLFAMLKIWLYKK